MPEAQETKPAALTANSRRPLLVAPALGPLALF
jgi:hypothetical protein